jgi:hypothetical protein
MKNEEVEKSKLNENKEKNEIKTSDRTLLELADQIQGYKIILDQLAIQNSKVTIEFWKRVKKLYPEINTDERWNYNHFTKTFARDC